MKVFVYWKVNELGFVLICYTFNHAKNLLKNDAEVKFPNFKDSFSLFQPFF